MASGINSTFRQVGIATGIALLGTLFASQVSSQVLARAAAVPQLARRGSAARRRGAVRGRRVGDRTAARARQANGGTIARTAFTTGLNRILLVAAIIALVSGAVALAAIRSKDFEHQQHSAGPRQSAP